MNEQEFWNSRDDLRYIRDYARSKGVRVAPWALLFTTLARLSVIVPPNVVIPAFAGGSPMGLNVFVALIGNSGDGKGLTERAARNLIPDIKDAVTTQPASGEGVASLFAKRATDEEGHSVLECTTSRALLSIPEITALGGTARRVGSTVVPTLTSAYSGETLGFWNKNEGNRLQVPEYGYRLSLITGVQPANLNVIMNEAGTGLPQRFLWADVLDPEAPERAAHVELRPFDVSRLPASPAMHALDALYQAGSRWNMMDHGDTGYPLTCMSFPECVADAVEHDSYLRLKGQRGDSLDSHGIGVRLKLAALFALLQQRLDVSEADWMLADYAYGRSSGFRSDCVKRARELACINKAKGIELDDEAREQAEQVRLESVKQRILTQLDRHDPAHEGMKGYAIRRLLGNRNGSLTYRAIESLLEDGSIDRLGEDKGTSSSTWARASY